MLETIAGVVEAVSVSPDTRRIAMTIREDDGRLTEAVAAGERAIAHQAVFRCGQRITLRGPICRNILRCATIKRLSDKGYATPAA